MRSFGLFAALCSALPVFAFAQTAMQQAGGDADVPAIQTGGAGYNQPPIVTPIPLINQAMVPLTPQESTGVSITNGYANARELPVQGDNGAVMFLYGAVMPAVVCAPLYVCDISLQGGEVVQDVNIGDAVRWKVSPAVSGSGTSKITHVLIKPTDSGLRTNLIVSTDRRVYNIQLVSTPHSYMASVAFNYPDDVAQQWANYRQQQANNAAATVLPSGQNIANLDFNYVLGGDSPAWKPLRVYSDGVKTYIQMPPTTSSADLPALVALADNGGFFSSPATQMVNYRVQNGTYVVDKVLDKAELIAGVGSRQQKVTITHSSPGGAGG